VQLFTGCMTDALAQPSLRAAIRLLGACGFDVEVPEAQNCCGALAQHAGDTQTAAQLAQNNLAAFDHTKPVVGIASGCCVTLAEYTSPEAESFTTQVHEVCAFLAGHADSLALQTLNKRIAIHTPCSQRNVLREEQAVSSLLNRIPGAEITRLPDVTACCGAAGSYMLDYPQQADAIRAPLVEAIASQQPDIVVTTNIGCAMHLQAGLREAGLDTEVQHPVDVLAKLLREA
jgi:glycolate oxidase iron-sulfur subunit